ncbi:phosphatidic acid phosphatase (PAP2) family protein [Striga asiatica]|uniref:Phosphatidic acid phosphatase (PAP2) family protein n=1 Tax=Striga asiatica TaxID=4170 RepID=A0A5A7PCW8_STRAF|nr:phosphatidic acid phosphatase (PAP2) family protein [Striga asiatica]
MSYTSPGSFAACGFTWPEPVGHAARIFTPGPKISGFKIPRLAMLGPLEEKAATTDGRELPTAVVVLSKSFQLTKIIAAPPILDINKWQKFLAEIRWLVGPLSIEQPARPVSPQHHICPQLPVHSTRANSKSPGNPINYIIVFRAVVSRREADKDTMLHRFESSYQHWVLVELMWFVRAKRNGEHVDSFLHSSKLFPLVTSDQYSP